MARRKTPSVQGSAGEGDPPVSDDPPGHDGNGNSGRDANGRFKPGRCPNPKGRPPKPKPRPGDYLSGILDKAFPFDIPGFPGPKTVRDALAYSACLKGLKEPNVAISLLKLDAQSKPLPLEGLPELDDEVDGSLDEILERHFEREARRRGIITKPVSEETDDEVPEA
jgi:hypothetical protein